MRVAPDNLNRTSNSLVISSKFLLVNELCGTKEFVVEIKTVSESNRNRRGLIGMFIFSSSSIILLQYSGDNVLWGVV